MKRISLIMIIFTILLTSCTTIRHEKIAHSTPLNNSLEEISEINIEISDLPESNINETETIIGLLELNKSNDFKYVLNENYHSRSMVSYKIQPEGSDIACYEKLDSLVGTEITIQCKIIETRNDWFKIIVITDLL